MRKDVNSGVDQQVFKRTAAHTKAINIGAVTYRGGTRL